MFKTIMTLFVLFGVQAALGGSAEINVQGSDTRKYISMWTPEGYVSIETRKLPVTAIRIENDCGKVILDTYMLRSSEKELLKALEK